MEAERNSTFPAQNMGPDKNGAAPADPEDWDLETLLNAPVLQSLMDDYAKMTATVAAILDLKGKVLLAVGWQDICTKFHRVQACSARNCTESDLFLTGNVRRGEYVAYKCRNGLWDVVRPLFVADRHMGNIYTGQFFYDDEVVDRSAFAAQAEAFGFDRAAYLEALDRVPRFSREQVKRLMDFLVKFTDLVSRFTLSNLQSTALIREQSRSAAALRRSEAALRESRAMLALILDTVPQSVFWKDREGRYLGCNKPFAEAVARFLMRVVFTFFAEDVGLLPPKIFEGALKGPWKQNSAAFAPGLEALWKAMDVGSDFPVGNLFGPNTGGAWKADTTTIPSNLGPLWDSIKQGGVCPNRKLFRFNGGLFQDCSALSLGSEEIEQLAEAAGRDWSQVDPSIFGTLLESALDPRERHRLGAHYTPRAFVERLLRPTIDEPLRKDWDLAQAEAMALLSDIPNEVEKEKAREVLHAFQRRLAHIKVLDPACGSGNFLAASYDVLKRIEGEVQRRLEELGETNRLLPLEGVMVTPAQFIGLEVKLWAAAITDLVLWISHLQWFHHQSPGISPPEPVLQAYGNIQCRDAVLMWSGTKATGRSRWDGQTTKAHPVTGQQVPDEVAQVPILAYEGAAPAAWPEADFIVGNPPFLGNKRMREALVIASADAFHLGVLSSRMHGLWADITGSTLEDRPREPQWPLPGPPDREGE